MARQVTQDVTKLPKWAQQHIESLERNVRELKNKINEGLVNSDTFAVDHGLDTTTPLGSETLIRFGSDSTRENVVEAHWDRDTRQLEVRATNGRLVIRPRVSNVVEIECEDF